MNVSLSDTKGNAWTSLTGRASIVRDRQKAEQLLAKPLQVWLPDDLDTTGLSLIKVEPDLGEFWEGLSHNVAYVAQTVRAAVTRNADHEPLQNKTVEMERKLLDIVLFRLAPSPNRPRI